MKPLTDTLRLPGVYFLPPPQPAPPGLPPLDVAAFVGFAARGPLHTPVPLESVAEYRAIFGGDLPLAREQGERLVHAQLPTAVSAFFANGGRRCHAVRVAGAAASATCLRLPRLVAIGPAGPTGPGPVLAHTAAASPGAWSAGLRLATRLRAAPLPVNAFAPLAANQLAWHPGSDPQALQAGDLLRFTAADGAHWLLPLTAVSPTTAGAYAPLQLTAAGAWQLVTQVPASPPPAIAELRLLTPDGAAPLAGLSAGFSSEPGRLALDLSGDVAALRQGDVLWLRDDTGAAWLFPLTALRRLDDGTTPASPPTSPPDARAVAAADAMLAAAPAPLPDASPPGWRRIERLRFDLLLQEAATGQMTLADLAFNHGHPRFWGDVVLLESSLLFQQSSAGADGQAAAEAARQFRDRQQGRHVPLNGRSAHTALAGLLAPLPAAAAAHTFLPLDMLAVLTADDFAAPAAAEVGSDDLGTFDARPFLDPDLVPDPDLPVSISRTLLDAAFDKLYVRGERLLGLHSLLFIDEVALLALPDAVQPGWQPALPLIDLPAPEPPPAPPDWSRFRVCAAADTAVAQEDDWEPPVALLPLLPERLPVPDADLPFAQRYPTLLNLQRALLDVCLARRDAVGILALPAHFEPRDCAEWQAALRQQLGLPRDRVALADGHGLADLSYLAVFHPWLRVADAAAPDRTRAVPPDGAVCGLVAARERRRYAWTAPANLPVAAALGLTPQLDRDAWAELFASRVNLLRREARDFRLMSAHTLADDPALLQLSVRRLLILLRKIALERGMDYVFETNDERLRQGVQLSLEETLTFLFERGAFAGATPRDAFRVVTDDSLNTRQRVEQGQFIAQIQVAPSQPLEFITVLLLRLSEGLRAAEV